MLKIYSSCSVFGSCLFSVGVRNNNVVNFLFFPFELSSCMPNNFLVSATAGEKCDTDITLPRYDSSEISAYSSNQNSDPLLTSACVTLWRSAEPQSTRGIWSGQWYRWYRGRLFFFSWGGFAKIFFSNQTFKPQQNCPHCHNPAECLD